MVFYYRTLSILCVPIFCDPPFFLVCWVFFLSVFYDCQFKYLFIYILWESVCFCISWSESLLLASTFDILYGEKWIANGV